MLIQALQMKLAQDQLARAGHAPTPPCRRQATVDLLAMPDPGSTFAGWSGDSDCADGSVTLKKSASCTAEFGQAGPVILVVGVTGNGSVTSTPVGINCGVDCTETWDAGTVVALTATAHSGSFFTGWSGDSDCSDGSVTLSASTSCHASFSGSPPRTAATSAPRALNTRRGSSTAS